MVVYQTSPHIIIHTLYHILYLQGPRAKFDTFEKNVKKLIQKTVDWQIKKSDNLVWICALFFTHAITHFYKFWPWGQGSEVRGFPPPPFSRGMRVALHICIYFSYVGGSGHFIRLTSLKNSWKDIKKKSNKISPVSVKKIIDFYLLNYIKIWFPIHYK